MYSFAWRQRYTMLKKLLEFAGFPGLIKQAEDIVQTVEKQAPTQAVASLMNWLPSAIERCHSPLQQLELLNTISPGATQIINSVHRELMASDGNLVKSNLLLKQSGPLAAWIRDQYSIHLQHALPTLQKSGPVAVWAQAMAHYLDWTTNAFVLAFFTPPPPSGLDWHTLYTIYEPTNQMLERACPPKLLGRADANRQSVQKSLAHLLLLVRSLSPDLDGRQILIAARIVDMLFPFLILSDKHGQNTPYGTDIHDSHPPTLLDGSKPPQSQHKFFFGMDAALLQLLGIENLVLAQGILPEGIVVCDSQGTTESLTVLKHLRNRWSGRPVVRKADRSLTQSSVDILVSTAHIHQHLFGDASPVLGHRSAPRFSAKIEDRSATGYGLLVDGPAPWAVVGSLLAILPPEVPRWSIGTIRRVSSRPQNKLMVGLQLMAMEPLALRLQETSKATEWQLVADLESLDTHSALYLPPSTLNSGQATLLTEDRILVPGEVYRARHGGQDLWLKIQAVLELGADYVQYSCQKTGTPPD